MLGVFGLFVCLFCTWRQLNISYPATGSQKTVDIEDELKVRPFFDKRISQEVPGDSLGAEFAGYIFRISGGNDKQGFPMKQGVLTPNRTRLLLGKGQSCFRERRKGARKRKSVRGCIVANDLSVLNLVIVKRGEADIPGVTDVTRPRRLGPKRASRIRRLFDLTKEDDVKAFVIRRVIKKEGKKDKTKAPKIQRLVTPARLQRKRAALKAVINRQTRAAEERAAYAQLLQNRIAEKRKARAEAIAKKNKVAPAAAAVKQAEPKSAAKPKTDAKPAAATQPAKAAQAGKATDTKAKTAAPAAVETKKGGAKEAATAKTAAAPKDKAAGKKK